MSRVFILQAPKAHMDLSSCAKYGDIVTLFVDQERRPSVFDTEEFGKEVLQRLEKHNFDPTVDYICVTGAMVALITGLIAIACAYDDFMILLFSSNSVQYVAKKVGFSLWGAEEAQPCKFCDGTDCDKHTADGKPIPESSAADNPPYSGLTDHS